MSEYEMAVLPELEGEYEGEWEGELEGEFEGGGIFRPPCPISPACGAIADIKACWPGSRADSAGRAREHWQAVGGGAGTAGGTLGSSMGSAIGSYLGGRLPQSDLRGVRMGAGRELSPIRRVYPDALMEHLGHAAAEAESEAEAEAFLGALIPLAAQLAPRVAPAIMRAAPGLIRGVEASPGHCAVAPPPARWCERSRPSSAARQPNIAQQAAQGQPMTPQRAVQTLARQTAQVLSSPQQCVQAYQRSRALDGGFTAPLMVLCPAG